MTKNRADNIENIQDFMTQKSNTKSPIQPSIKSLVRDANKNKYSYDQLKYIFKSVREQCQIEVPKNKKELYELPSSRELAQFYNSIDNPVHKLMFEFLEGTGLRVGKFCDLAVTRIDWDNNTILIKNAKGAKDRIIVLGNRIKEKLLIYLNGKNNKYLFESNRNTRFSTRRIEQICEQYVKKSGIATNITPHTFRHIFNTYLAQNKVSKENRMMLTGHESEQAQNIYTHLAVGGIKDEIIEILDKK